MAEAQTVLTASQHAADMAGYIEAGRARALTLGNRGPLRFTADGKLHPEILEAYWKHGFYVLEDVIDAVELAELREGIDVMLRRAPVAPGADVDAEGRLALGHDLERNTYLWVTPLADPVGGTAANGGRHPAKMSEPVPDGQAPEKVIYMMFNMCEAMDAGLRVYGHPGLLAVAEAINGPDFVPYNDAIFVKQPGLGASVAWHQDGLTHWNSPDWDEGIHGFNFQVQLYRCTPANCLWVMPGTHKLGRIDIKRLVEENGGSDRLPEAVPLFCEAGSVTIVNRQLLHGSFANTSPDLRVSLTFGFHRRASVLGQRGVLVAKADEVYDEERIFERASVIATAIDARRQHFAEETAFAYQPFVGLEERFRWNEAARARLKNYSLKDLGI
ncbi:MAG TPA: phytanoyl-CoA dioxygenase family protein [Pseudomonadales bacterium]